MGRVPYFHVLLIEDSESDLMLTREYLELCDSSQYETEWIQTYEDAERRILAGPLRCDVVLIDYYLGQHRGLELLKLLKQQQCPPATIVLTGRGDSKADIESLHAGASDFLVKDEINPHLLDRSIRYAVEQRRNEKLVLRQQRELSAMLKLAAMEEMLSTVSHEINNPLTIIQAKMAVIDRLLRAEKVDVVKIGECAETASKMVTRIVDIKSALKKRHGNLNVPIYEDVNVLSLVKEAISLCADRIGKSGSTIELQEKEVGVLCCNAIELSQVLVNLIGNACDAISSLDQRWIRIEISRDSKEIEIVITDSGVVTDPETRNKMFKKSFTTKSHGMGIGLHLSSRIVESYGGSLQLADDHPNTQFRIRLPTEHKRGTQATYRILVVDDEEEILQIFADEARERGHEAIVESDPMKAKERLLVERFDAVIFDIRMPGLSGLELAELVRKQDGSPTLAFISGLFTSAVLQKIDQMSPGERLTFEKPLDAKTVLDQVLGTIDARIAV